MPDVLDDEADADVQTSVDQVEYQRLIGILSVFAKWMRTHAERVSVSYLVPERDGFGWYVISRSVAFDFALNRELADFAATLAARQIPMHTTLLPGSADKSIPKDAIILDPLGVMKIHAQ